MILKQAICHTRLNDPKRLPQELSDIRAHLVAFVGGE